MNSHKLIDFNFRTCRYKLNHVQVSPKVKTDANDKILDFIRSRPPLKPVSERVLPPRKRKESTARELILEVKILEINIDQPIIWYFIGYCIRAGKRRTAKSWKEIFQNWAGKAEEKKKCSAKCKLSFKSDSRHWKEFKHIWTSEKGKPKNSSKKTE